MYSGFGGVGNLPLQITPARLYAPITRLSRDHSASIGYGCGWWGRTTDPLTEKNSAVIPLPFPVPCCRSNAGGEPLGECCKGSFGKPSSTIKEPGRRVIPLPPPKKNLGN